MLTREEIKAAARYNQKNLNVSYKLEQLPDVFSLASHEEFVAWICVYQSQSGLKVDGQLGPKTLAKIEVPVNGPDFSMRDSIPPKSDASNNVIILGKKVRIPQEMIDEGYTMTNFLEDGEPKFKSRRRNKALKWFVIHETCGNTADGCKRTLQKKGSGVALIQAPDGTFSCHGDVVLDRMVHANQLNNGATGCEQVNPYNPVYVRDESIFGHWIKRRWWTWVPGSKNVTSLLKKKGWKAVPKKYVTLTTDQVESMKMFLPWLIRQIGVIPYEFPTKDRKRGSAKVKWPKAGIVAHQDFSSHADGRYMLEILAEEPKWDRT